VSEPADDRCKTWDPTPGCLFCRRDEPSLNHVSHENATFFARYDNFPVSEGHSEIVPKRHVESFFDLTPAEVQDAFTLILAVRQELWTRFQPPGYTIGVNEGKAAGRTIDHLHIHVIPRYFGDVPDPRGGIRQVLPNFLPDQWVTSQELDMAQSVVPEDKAQ
jgi:diadenosine tetraphosphate (Ap4A) HIT family hydrolase